MCFTPRKTNSTMENPPFEDAFPIEHVDFPMSCEFSGVYLPSVGFQIHRKKTPVHFQQTDRPAF